MNALFAFVAKHFVHVELHMAGQPPENEKVEIKVLWF